tara:strand:+ start:921 stop:1133 length:213 start_codon:yes stop_codon:yes gene_type:complete
MSRFFDEAVKIISLVRDLTVADYKKFKELSKKISDNERKDFAWLGEALFQRLPEIAEKEGNYDFLEDEDK